MTARASAIAYPALVAFVLAFAAGCEFVDPNPGPDAVDPAGSGQVDRTPPSVAAGEQLYRTNCERCHGAEAEGTLIWPAPLWGLEEPADVVINGVRSMPAFPTLSDSQIVSIELFLGQAGPPPTTNAATNFQRFCEGCHGGLAAGGPFFPSSIQGFTPIRDVVRNGRGEMPALTPPRLSDASLDSLEEYIGGLVDLSAYSGEEYYVARCAGCHGFAAEGTERGYPLRRPVVPYARYIIREGRPGIHFPNTMPAFRAQHLNESQLTELVAYVSSFDKPVTGRGLYETYCANCHGVDGRGGVVGVNLVAELGSPAAYVTAVRGGNAGNRFWDRQSYMPAYSVAEISDEEVQLIRTFLSGL